jgi:hypothetical protein
MLQVQRLSESPLLPPLLPPTLGALPRAAQMSAALETIQRS